jgi:hypothetical protein
MTDHRPARLNSRARDTSTPYLAEPGVLAPLSTEGEQNRKDRDLLS